MRRRKQVARGHFYEESAWERAWNEAGLGGGDLIAFNRCDLKALLPVLFRISYAPFSHFFNIDRHTWTSTAG